MFSQVIGSPAVGVGVFSSGAVVTVARGVCVDAPDFGDGVVGSGEALLHAVRERAATSAQTARGVRFFM